MAPNCGQGLTLDIVTLEKKKAQLKLKLLIGDVQSQALTPELQMLNVKTRPQYDYFSLVFFFHSEGYPNSVEAEFDLLRPLNNDDSLTKVIFPSQVHDFRVLFKSIKVYVKNGVFCLIDIDEHIRGTADLMKIFQSQSSSQSLGKHRLPCSEFTL